MTEPRRGVASTIFLVILLVLLLTSCTNDRWSYPDVGTTPVSGPQSGTPTVGQGNVGAVDVVDCGTIAGWALDKSRPASLVSVDVLDGETVIGTALADLPRPDLQAAGLGNGKGGFTYSVPATVKDGRTHQIRVRFSNTNLDLQTTPVSLSC